MDDSRIRVIERAIEILDAIRVNRGSAGISEISRNTGIAKSTVFRILNTMLQKGYVRRSEQNDQYALGYKLIEMSFSATGTWEVVNLALPYLEHLKDASHETAALAVKVGLQYTFVSQAACQHEYRVNPVLGERYYLHWAGTGKAILAHVSKIELDEILKIVPSTAAAERTVRDPAELLKQIEQIRKTGFAYSFSERVEGGASYSAPILDANGKANAAVSIIGPEIRLRKMDPDQTGAMIGEVAKQLAHIYQISGISFEYCT